MKVSEELSTQNEAGEVQKVVQQNCQVTTKTHVPFHTGLPA